MMDGRKIAVTVIIALVVIGGVIIWKLDVLMTWDIWLWSKVHI